MEPTFAGQARSRRPGVIVAVAIIAVVVAGVTVGILMAIRPPADAAGPATTPTNSANPTPAATALTPSEALLATTTDPAACAVSFAGDGIAQAPMLQTQDALFAGLPIPNRDGLVFAGWYATAADAASFSVPGRVNGADVVACVDRQVTLTGSWKTPDENVAEDARIPILMYHQFTTNPQGESGPLRGNYAYIGDFDAHMNHIATTGFYLPTWDELGAFIDGRLFLPNHSVIVTDDDADHTWLELAAPVVDKYKLLTTSFVITVFRSEPSPNAFVIQRSHTHDMHRAGDDGQGRIVNLPVEEIVADMETSYQILGAKEIMAYPFGHYDDTAKEGLRQAGWDLARTIEPGYVTIGSEKLALPTVRINYGMDLGDLVGLIG